ncbi:MAG: hypothetical protein CMN34_06065 [Saprospirales bacterium]|nr:hypothetical protein [Saprospirales bacterium]
MSYTDSALDAARLTMVADIEAQVSTANKDELLKYARMVKNLRETDNVTIETLINSRLESLLATEDDVDTLLDLSDSLSKVLDLVQPNTESGRELPTQSGNGGKYLTTDGTNVSWGTPALSDVSDLTSVSDGEVPVYSGSGFTGETLVNKTVATEYNSVASLPASASNGDFAFTLDNNNIYYWNGSAWTAFGGFTK